MYISFGFSCAPWSQARVRFSDANSSGKDELTLGEVWDCEAIHESRA